MPVAATSLAALLLACSCASQSSPHEFDTAATRGPVAASGARATLHVNEFIDDALVPGLLAVCESLFERVEVQVGGDLPADGETLAPALEEVIYSPLRGEGVFQNGILSVAHLTWRIYRGGELAQALEVHAKGRASGPWANERVMHEARWAALQAVLEESRRELVALLR
jgi:hypothetical protein